MDALVVAVSCSPQLTTPAARALLSCLILKPKVTPWSWPKWWSKHHVPPQCQCWAQRRALNRVFNWVSLTAFCKGICFWVQGCLQKQHSHFHTAQGLCPRVTCARCVMGASVCAMHMLAAELGLLPCWAQSRLTVGKERWCLCSLIRLSGRWCLINCWVCAPVCCL